MRRIGSYLAAFLAAALLASCGSSNPPVCGDLSTDATLGIPIIGPNWNVTYSITVTGSASVNSLQYRDANGVLQTVASPASNWSHSNGVMTPGSRVTLIVTANAPPGTVATRTQAASTDGSETVSYLDSCGE
jgi:hypothetical protein